MVVIPVLDIAGMRRTSWTQLRTCPTQFKK